MARGVISKRSLSIVLLASAVLVGLSAESSAGEPGGSYSKSCKDIRVSGVTLEASCRKAGRNAPWANTSLADYQLCSGDISNENGTLTCNKIATPGRVISLAAVGWNKEWNSNPLAGGCKRNYSAGFTVPPNTVLYAIGLAGPGKKCSDMAPFDSPTGTEVSQTLGGAQMLSRPPPGAGPGQYMANVHWWFDQWGASETSVCAWVIGAAAVSEPQSWSSSFDNSKVQQHKFPFCFSSLSVSGGVNWDADFNPTGPAGGINASGFTWSSPRSPCYVMWPGCD
jgi:hypothetical protein